MVSLLTVAPCRNLSIIEALKLTGLVLLRTAKSEQCKTMFKNYHTDINRSF
ncbi:conserved hypothetical protein [Treponema phagedenis]|uniref:Uncharacterized protein n=1 Tax=Treponema phagedenis TaxID=162 RepID=A0A0B7GRW8_TREPH|nr:conserved hypothetical protein [Treponema phagedenis]